MRRRRLLYLLLMAIGSVLVLFSGALVVLHLLEHRVPLIKPKPGIWQRIEKGMHEDEVVQILGRPVEITASDTVDGGWLEPRADYSMLWKPTGQPTVECYFGNNKRVLLVHSSALDEAAQAQAQAIADAGKARLVESNDPLAWLWKLLGY